MFEKVDAIQQVTAFVTLHIEISVYNEHNDDDGDGKEYVYRNIMYRK